MLREKRAESDPSFSLRQVAARLGVEPSYLSKIEVGDVPPSDDMIKGLAKVFGEDADILALMAGKLPESFITEVRKRPHVFAEFLRQAKSIPDGAILRIVREVRDGKW